MEYPVSDYLCINTHLPGNFLIALKSPMSIDPMQDPDDPIQTGPCLADERADSGCVWLYHVEKQRFKGLEFTRCWVDLQPQQLHGGDP